MLASPLRFESILTRKTTATNEEILAHRQQLIKNSIRKIKNLSIYDVCMFLFNFILACTWLRVACGCFLLFVEHGFNERCGWEGNKTVCYMLVWEQMSRLYVPYVAFIQGATSLDCLVRSLFEHVTSHELTLRIH